MKIYNSCVNNCGTMQKSKLNDSVNKSFQAFESNQKMSAPLGYHRAMFEANQNVSNINFAANIDEGKLIQLKNTLSKICGEAIEKYNSHDVSLEQNLFGKAYIQHCFNFVAEEGNTFHNLSDPFNKGNWGSYHNFRQRIIDSGQKPIGGYTSKLNNGIASWNEKFIQGIVGEQDRGENRLLDELLNIGDDLGQVKNRLGIPDSLSYKQSA